MSTFADYTLGFDPEDREEKLMLIVLRSSEDFASETVIQFLKSSSIGDVKMVKKGKIALYQEQLDKTLASHNLTDKERLKTLVKDQLLGSQLDDQYEGYIDNVLAKRTAELSNFLDMLRSASDSYAISPQGKPHASWKLKQDNEEFRIMYREGPEGSPFHTLLVEGYVDAPVDACLCVSWETALYPTWFPETRIPAFKVIISKCLQKVGIGEHISLVRMKLSWPLSNREAVLNYFEFEYFEDGLVIVLLNTVPDAESLQWETHDFTDDETEEAGHAIKLEVVGGFALQKVTEDRSYMRAIANLDVKLDFVPPSVINFISRQLLGIGFRLYQKTVASISKGDTDFDKALSDPLYKRVREGISLKGKPEKNLETGVVHSGLCTDTKEHNQTGNEEFQNEDQSIRGGDDISESSPKYELPGKDWKTSTEIEEARVEEFKIREEAARWENAEENSRSADQPNTCSSISNCHFKKNNVGLSLPVEQALRTLDKAILVVREVRLNNRTWVESGFADKAPKLIEGEESKPSTPENHGISSSHKEALPKASAEKIVESNSQEFENGFTLHYLRHEASNPFSKELNPRKELSNVSDGLQLASHFTQNGSAEAAAISGKMIDERSQVTVDSDYIHEDKPTEGKKSGQQQKWRLCCT
ncbi:hypothetical protein Nepgr_011520 [Nepenthes gracilis]|uniref:START domain-containing protein n=1 Tax=Nepenthes gracilis TaxID=150966 RepID=A0AAD3SFH3_NEPGR|nr:hypothetical protein Nepgr_011520 [Nepenthes gracilis]